MKNLAILALLGHVSLVSSQEAKLLPGPCPTFKTFDLDMNKLSGKPFQLLYGEKDSNGGYCIENKFSPFGDGKNTSRWQMNTVQRIPISMITGKEEDKNEYENFNNDDYVVVFRDEDIKNGINNLGHVFNAKDLLDETKVNE